MNLWEAKDIVRSHFGGTAFPTIQLDHALTQGRRKIETHANYWWMQDEVDFSLTIDQQEYPVYSGAINLPNFKDLRALSWREAAGVSYSPVWFGDTTKEELDVLYDTDDEGSPEIAVIENSTIYLYPPNPDKAYSMRMYFYQWTDNPAQTADDDLLNFFPMALVYSALAWGYELELKDMQGAAYWNNLLGGTPFGRGGELAKLKKENFKRGWRDQLTLTPRTGPGVGSLRRISNLQIYGSRVS
jgi:hypothetical protein